ncbi:SUKH-4 family immunity protein [Dactylosporangium sp. NBC_01737]|uniref:hypothetical protein n=1 Tax=Dactylosporangium sp. NBC_01737 TaxID=2975959 RepID=UPI002E112DB2|nr:SUKH-4 family immunity protein [Dactylosporangium sp. NBC_01737]
MVIAVPNFRELAGPLRDLHPEGVADEVINSGAGAFVDFSWRWYWLSEILCSVHDEADRSDDAAWHASSGGAQGVRPGADFDAYEPYRLLCSEVRRSFAAVDQEAFTGASSMWSNLIGGFD